MTVLEALDPDHDPVCCACPRRLFTRAALCGHLAKLGCGTTRRQLYRFKDACLATLRTRFPDDVESRGDHDRHRGLLSIALKRDKRRRLHSHEAWMPAA